MITERLEQYGVAACARLASHFEKQKVAYPNAFDRALKESHDVRALFNHDPNHLLGRSTANTVGLSVDQTGLKYVIDLPDTQTGRDVGVSISRGDLSGSSFSFANPKAEFERDNSRKIDIRMIHDLDLFDVGPVTFPAYEATTVGVRSAETSDAKIERDAWRASQILKARAVAVRSRLLTLEAG